MERLNEKLLARYYDGELSPGERARVETLLAQSGEDVKALDDVARISDMVQVMREESLNDVSFEGFDKRVLNLIDTRKEEPSLSERLSVWFKEFFSYRKVVWIPAASLVGAASAALLVVGLSGSPQVPGMPGAGQPETWVASGGNTVFSEARIANTSEVHGTEYQIVRDGGQSIGVVWIDD